MDAYGKGTKTTERPRCWRCNKLLAELVTAPWRITCPRCKALSQQE
jgi:phage FluMu protein Com